MPQPETYAEAREQIEKAIMETCPEEGVSLGWVLVAEFDHPIVGRTIVQFESAGSVAWQMGGYLQYALDHMEDEDDVD